MLNLNLGCGRFPFPLDRENIPNPEHLNPLPEMVFESGWVNVDKFSFPGVNNVIDLFRFPWVINGENGVFPDSTFDAIWAAHIVEHVPHIVRTAHPMPAGLAGRYADLCENYDGFFVFFSECWRLLKPGGLIYVRAPMGVSYPSLSDPTHTRYLTPGTFGYLKPAEEGVPFDYHIPFHFEQHEPYFLRFRGEWASKLDHYTEKGMAELFRRYNDVADEFRIVLRAIKE